MQEVQNITNTTNMNTASKESGFLSLFHFVLLFVFIALYSLPFILKPELWLKHYSDYALALDYIRENGFQLAVQISDGVYLREFPFAFWVLGFFTNFFPHISNSILLISFYIASLFLFAFSVYILGYALFFSSRVAISASCIALTSFFAIGYTPFAGYDLYFVAFVNLSLAFAFRAYIKPVAPVFLFLAFIFMTFGFFAGGFFAYALRIFTSITFLILCGNFSRFKRNDVYIFTLSFLAVLIVAFVLFYTAGHREYVALLSDFTTFQKALESWELATHAVYYVLAILFVFLPYIFIFFFINTPKAFAPVVSAIKGVKHRLSKKESKEVIEEEIEEELEDEFQSETLYPLLRTDKEEINEEDIDINSQIQISEEELKLRKKRSRLSSLFLFSVLFSGLFLLCVFPISTFTYVLFLSPAFSLLFAKQVYKLSEQKSRVFFSLIAWLILAIGVMCIASGMLPEWGRLYPSFFATLPKTLEAVILSPSKGAFFLFGAMLIALSLIYLFSNKSNVGKSLLRLIMFFVVLSWGLNFIIYSHVELQVTATQQIVESAKTTSETNSTN